MGFSLLENPFAVLGLGIDANPAQISGRAREVGGDLASVASRALISPRTRLQAEIAFLPGLSEKETQACLSALASGRAPEFSKFAAVSRANILAHLASSGRATAPNLELLFETATSVRQDALEILNRGRQSAAMPPIPQPMFDSAVEQLACLHAEALSEGALALKHGADVLSGIVESLGSSVTGASVFLRQTMAAWERATASEGNKDLESAQELTAKLKAAPDSTTVAELSSVIRAMAGRTRPSRALARHFGLPHDASAEMVDNWRSLAVDLVKEHKALSQAETILDSLAKEFGTSDGPGQRVARDLAACRERIASGEDLPEVARFAAALEAAEKEAAQFKGDVLARMARDSRGRYNTLAIVVELWEAFIAAAPNASSDAPWKALRAFAVRLHNDFSASESALALTDLALKYAYGNPLTDEVRPQLEADRRLLLRHALGQKLNAAIEKKQRGTARQLLSQLVPLAENGAERQEYASTLRRLQWQAAKLFVSRSFYALIAMGILYAIVTDKNRPSGTGSAPYSTYTPTAVNPPMPVIAVDDGKELRPPPGIGVLSRSQLRWCLFQDARLTAAKAYLDNLGTSQYIQSDAFNRAIVVFNTSISDFNASCGQYRYYTADKSAVDAELSMKALALQAEGQRLGAAGYVIKPNFPAPQTVLSAPPATYSPPAHSSSGGENYPPAQFQASGAAPQSSYSGAYADGQQDRRALGAWFAGLIGDFRQGADWWAGVRSMVNPPPCTKAPGTDRVVAVRGCNEAKSRLASADRRRRAEPDYRAGWNNP
jgi:hypothetical protein